MTSPPSGTADDEPQTAMLLTQQEWDDLARMVSHYKMCTEWVTGPRSLHLVKQDPDSVRDINRRRLLADRIVEAA